MKQINYRIEYEDGIDIARDWTDFLRAVDEIGSMEEYEAASDILLKMHHKFLDYLVLDDFYQKHLL